MSNWKHISVDDLHAQYKDWNVVDIRDANTYEQGHIPGALNLSNDNINQFVDDADQTKPLAVICYGGKSSMGAAEVLSNAGFETVYSVDGGMMAWQSSHPNEMDSSES